MKLTLPDTYVDKTLTQLGKANHILRSHYPGDRGDPQPIHTLYGGAQLYKKDSTRKIGELAVTHFLTYAPDPKTLAFALGFAESKLWTTVHERVLKRLKSCAVEDFRIDFEDGYGNRPNEEEDGHAQSTAREVAAALSERILPPFIGIRIKPFNDELKWRSARTMDIFLSTLLEESKGILPPNFVITLPKVSIPEQVQAFVELLSEFERQRKMPQGTIHIEIMIETTQALMSAQGHCNLPKLLQAAQGRCRGAHFGTYDYTACFDVTAAHQRMDHPACDFALNMMKIAYAQTGCWLSTGATSIMPVPIHRAQSGEKLTDKQIEENQAAVHNAWRLAFGHITHSLVLGYYQGWDLHPGQLSMRYAAAYYFFLAGIDQASTRLSNFLDKAAQATLVGDVFDDAATGQGLLNFFLRAYNAGAIGEDEIRKAGIKIEELRTKSFLAILQGRKK